MMTCISLPWTRTPRYCQPSNTMVIFIGCPAASHAPLFCTTPEFFVNNNRGGGWTTTTTTTTFHICNAAPTIAFLEILADHHTPLLGAELLRVPCDRVKGILPLCQCLQEHDTRQHHKTTAEWETQVLLPVSWWRSDRQGMTTTRAISIRCVPGPWGGRHGLVRNRDRDRHMLSDR